MATAYKFPGQLLPTVRNIRIVHPTGGASIRTLGAGSGSTTVFKTPSFRWREAHGVEGLCAVLLEKNDEVVADIADSRPEPFMIFGDVEGYGHHRSTPDRVRMPTTGVGQIVECKDSVEAFFKPKNIVQAALGQAAADVLGFDYVRLTPSMLGSRQFKANVSRIYGARGTHVPDRVAVLASQLLADGPMKLGDFTAKLHSTDINGFAMACAMMVRRIVEIDLTVALGHSSLVRLMAPIPKWIPSIRYRPRVK